MSLRLWLIRARLAWDETRHTALRAARSAPAAASPNTIQLEDRVLLSASPAPVVADGDGAAMDESATLLSAATEAPASAPADNASGDDVRTAANTLAFLDGLIDDVSVANQDDRFSELVFVDDSIADIDQLLDDLQQQRGLGRDFTIIRLDPHYDGVARITEALAERQDVDAVHIVSHGTEWGFKLGNVWLTSENLDEYRAALQGWGQALSDQADLLLYGCDLAASDDGRTLLDHIAALTGADVAASVDPTGHALQGGDWDLEYMAGELEAQLAFTLDVQQNWSHRMAADTVRDNFNSVSYGNSDGSQPWASAWVESDTDGGGASSGRIRVTGDQLRISARYSGDSIYRQVDLSAAQSATLIFSYNNALASGRVVTVQMSSDGGGSYTTVATFDSATNTGAGSKSIDVSSYISANARIRIEVANGGTPDSFIYFDDVQVVYVTDSLSNSAPFLEPSKSPVLTATQEDAGSPAGTVGTLVSSLVDFGFPTGQVDNVTDPDPNALLGIAITAADTANGSWWYSIDNGTNWHALDAVADNNARLLAADTDTRIYFQPNANYNGTLAGAITFRAWDQTSGSNGSTADTSTNGGTTAFSSATDTASLVVTAVNDTPTIVVPAAQSTAEDTEKVFSVAGGNAIVFGDVDAGGSSVRVSLSVSTGTLTLNGTTGLSFSAGDGSDDNLVTFEGTLTDINAAVDGLRFMPSANFHGLAILTVSIDDLGNSGAGGPQGDADAIIINVTSVNDAPTLVDTAVSLNSVGENDGVPSGAVGTLVSQLANLSPPAGGQDNVTDPDNSPQTGIALVGADATNGTWWFTTDGGSNWTVLGAVGNSSARLLAANATTRVYFQPSGTFSGTIAAALTFRAWDRTAGTNGQAGVDTTINGGVTAFSASTDTAELVVTAVNDAPVFTSPDSVSVPENQTGVLTVTASDEDGDTPTYSISGGADQTRFSIGTLSGVLTFLAAPNYESPADADVDNAYVVEVTADDGRGGITSQLISVTVTDVNEWPTITSNGGGATAAISVAENSTAVSTVTATDPDLPAQTLSYSIVGGADAAHFTIDSSSGVLSFVAAPNREAPSDADSNSIYEVTVQVSDGNLTDSQAISVTVTDVDEFDVGTVSDANAVGNAVDENATNGTPVAITAFAVDADATTNAITYSLDDSAGGRFAIHATTGVVTVANGSLLNREAVAAHNITVRATSADGSFSTETFTIDVNDVDEFDVTAPADTDGAANAVNENAANGTAVGITASASDADATTNTITYSLIDNAGGRFTIDANSGIVTVANGLLLDRESAASHNITVRATSADGSTANTTFTINLNDVDEFDVGTVTDSNTAPNTVAENATVGTAVGLTALATDADATATITYSLDDDAGGRFAIHATTGVVTVNGALDYETATSHSVTIRATSSDGSQSTQAFTIAVTDVNESGVGAISDTDGAAEYVLENAANGTTVGLTAFADDPDGTDTVGYSLSDMAHIEKIATLGLPRRADSAITRPP
ncbi:MAG: DUF4347 domain-containing protein [Planctomycetes bacterium]|nr:DUF4347 domain-containing protein [Planctomycetota bacterium]